MTKTLFDEWPRVKRKLKNAERVLILLDYDGTLSPIAPRPEKAVFKKGLKKTLTLLSKKRNVLLGVISGRELRQVRKIIGINGIYYAGNHGLEIKGGKKSFIHPAARRFSFFVKEIKKSLDHALKDVEGVIVEAKGATLTVHYRLVKKKDLRRLKRAFNKISSPYIRKKEMKLSCGKKCWELMPPVDWNKGKAVEKILKDLGTKRVLTIYIGDDRTDEDAFRVLRNKGITVFVGSRRTKTNAKYSLKSVSEVSRFLKRLYDFT